MSPSVDAVKRLSPDRPSQAVLVPESFRGGCSVGADAASGVRLSRMALSDKIYKIQMASIRLIDKAKN
jgi:hypothetical protein